MLNWWNVSPWGEAWEQPFDAAIGAQLGANKTKFRSIPSTTVTSTSRRGVKILLARKEEENRDEKCRCVFCVPTNSLSCATSATSADGRDPNRPLFCLSVPGLVSPQPVDEMSCVHNISVALLTTNSEIKWVHYLTVERGGGEGCRKSLRFFLVCFLIIYLFMPCLHSGGCVWRMRAVSVVAGSLLFVFFQCIITTRDELFSGRTIGQDWLPCFIIISMRWMNHSPLNLFYVQQLCCVPAKLKLRPEQCEISQLGSGQNKSR